MEFERDREKGGREREKGERGVCPSFMPGHFILMI
jgi:hypothetical protein